MEMSEAENNNLNEGKLSHKQWRALQKRQKRKAKRQQLAREKEATEAKEEEEKEKSAEYLRKILDRQMFDKYQAEAEEKQRAFLHSLWLRREQQAQEWFRLKQKRLEEECKRREEEEQRIREEWEERQRIEKENEEKRKQEEEERKEKQEKLLKEATAHEKTGEDAWHNPIAPVRKEQLREICPFYAKVGVCRFRERCSRAHPDPDITTTLLFPGMYANFKLDQSMRDEYDTDLALEYDDGELYQHFLEFYEDVLPEFRSIGRVIQLKVCCNHEPHLRGNVYVQYAREEDACKAMAHFNSRWYAGKQLSCYFVHIAKWQKAICGLHFMKTCPKGKNCNFLHVFRNPRKEFKDADHDRSPRNHRSHRESRRYGNKSSRHRRSRSPRHRSTRSRRRSYSRSRSRSPKNSISRSRQRSYSRSRSRSPSRKMRSRNKSRTRDRSYSRSPEYSRFRHRRIRSRSYSSSRSRSRSRSPYSRKYQSKFRSRSRSNSRQRSSKAKERAGTGEGSFKMSSPPMQHGRLGTPSSTKIEETVVKPSPSESHGTVGMSLPSYPVGQPRSPCTSVQNHGHEIALPFKPEELLQIPLPFGTPQTIEIPVPSRQEEMAKHSETHEKPDTVLTSQPEEMLQTKLPSNCEVSMQSKPGEKFGTQTSCDLVGNKSGIYSPSETNSVGHANEGQKQVFPIEDSNSGELKLLDHTVDIATSVEHSVLNILPKETNGMLNTNPNNAEGTSSHKHKKKKKKHKKSGSRSRSRSKSPSGHHKKHKKHKKHKRKHSTNDKSGNGGKNIVSDSVTGNGGEKGLSGVTLPDGEDSLVQAGNIGTE